MEKFGKGKTVLLGMPDWFMYQEVKDKLESFGFEVIGIPFSSHFRYKTFWERSYNFLRKSFLGDKNYKIFLRYRDNGRDISKTIDGLTHQVDYAFIIRADYYPMRVISKIRKRAQKMIGYQWDGLDRYPQVKTLIPLFDRFFVFDPGDLNFPNVLPATNFIVGDVGYVPVEADLDVYYVGNYVRSRINKIQNLSNYLAKIGANSIVKIYAKNEKIIEKYKDSSFDISNSYISYQENLNYVGRARVLIDLLHGVHQGLSFRVFEAIGYGKKLITDNEEILKYDFYDSHNIYIIKNNNLEGLDAFIKSPYRPLPKDVVSKYSLENWLRYTLDIQPYVEIELPN